MATIYNLAAEGMPQINSLGFLHSPQAFNMEKAAQEATAEWQALGTGMRDREERLFCGPKGTDPTGRETPDQWQAWVRYIIPRRPILYYPNKKLCGLK